MKTVKIKVLIDECDQSKVERWCSELEWLWNQARRVALHNHCIEWYKWASKKAKDKNCDFYGVSFDGCILTPLRLSKKGAWIGAACQIGVGGPYFKKDKTLPPIKYYDKSKFSVVDGLMVRTSGKEKYKPAVALTEGDKPYKAVTPAPHSFIEVNGKQIKSANNLGTMLVLNPLRSSQSLERLTTSSFYAKGLLKDFETSWKAYADVKLPHRGQPLYKDGENNAIQTLAKLYPPALKEPKGGKPYFFCSGGIKAIPCDKNWRSRIGNMVMRSYKLISKPSGWYLCVSVASESESLKPTLKSRKSKRSTAIKKAYPGISKKELDKIKASDDVFKALANDLSSLEQLIELELFEASTCRKTTGRTAGIDPGVVSIVSTSEGHQFNPNYRRGKVKSRISELQHRLDIMRNANDKRAGKQWKKGERDATKNESKLQLKVKRLHECSANMSNAFNHKLSTRLARMFDEIAWEDTQLGNMKRKSAPVLSESGNHYERNSAAAKSGLNESLSNACIGDLKSKTKQKVIAARKRWVDAVASYTSQRCHCCGSVGNRPTQNSFYCLDDTCKMYEIKQNADVNAGKNIKKSLAKV